MGEKFVGLRRVSTERQEKSGLGLEAGLEDIQRYIREVQGELIVCLDEVGSGGKGKLLHRPTLVKAINLCKRHDATLLVPKIDRLVRSTQVYTDLNRTGVKIRAIDNPHATEFTLDILVAVAANERRQISQRTKDALRIYKSQKRISKRTLEMYKGPDGVYRVPPEVVLATAGKLGTQLQKLVPRDNYAARNAGRAAHNAQQHSEYCEAYQEDIRIAKEMRESGLTIPQIIVAFNQQSKTRNGSAWGKSSIFRLLCAGGYAPKRRQGKTQAAGPLNA